MSVAPDMLLRPAPEVKSKAAPVKAPEKSAEPSKSKASEFSQMYARERQSKAAERADSQQRAARDDRAKPADEVSSSADDAAAQPLFADSGKGLPESIPAEAGGLDPLLLLGMTGELPLLPEGADALSLADEAETAPVLIAAAPASLTSSGPASMTEASFDPEIDALNQLPGVRMALALGAHDQQPAEQASPVAHAVKAAQASGSALAPGLSAVAQVKAENAGVDLAELELGKFSVKALQVAKEGATDISPEQFVSKLNSLSQAIAQQGHLRSAPLLGQPVAMHQGGWSEAVVDRVMLMSSQNLKSAEIQLDPAELGRLEVRISVNQEQTQVTFASPNANVRDALEAQMHRLREMLGQQGMSLLDANVSDQSLSRGWQGQGDEAGGGRGGAETGLLADDERPGVIPESAQVGMQTSRGLVDYYA